MKIENLIATARLWDQEALAQQAEHWTGPGAGKFFPTLKRSQLGALERAAFGTKGRAGLLAGVRNCVKGAAKRGKGQNGWTEENARQMRQALHDVLKVVRASTTGAGKAYAGCREILENEGRASRRTALARDEAILREFMAMVVKIGRSKGKRKRV